MTDAEAHYRSILENPADDLARLTYADRLEENGESERAEFIRVQIQAARCEVCRGKRTFHYGDYLCHNCQPYYDRERELWTTVQSQFVSPSWQVLIKNDQFGTVPEELVGTVGTVGRGFVATVRTTLAGWVGGACICGGHGIIRNGIAGPIVQCRGCSSTGRTPAHGPRIVAEQPVESLVITDAAEVVEQIDRDPGFNEWRVHHPDFQGRKWFPTRELALDGVGLIYLNWARREAGLPPLTPSAA